MPIIQGGIAGFYCKRCIETKEFEERNIARIRIWGYNEGDIMLCPECALDLIGALSRDLISLFEETK